MSAWTGIQWCDGTVNPVMGCDGCELWNDEKKICYAGTLHQRFGGHTPGYAKSFEIVTNFPGRMAKAAGWSDMKGTKREGTEKKPAKPWLDNLRRLIFVSDMGDALSGAVTFEYLYDEIFKNVTSKNGKRHVWLWLTKRPGRMLAFCKWVKETHGQDWPENLWPGTSVTTQKSAERIDNLIQIGGEGTTRFLSVEPQWEHVSLNRWLRKGVGWVIQGGESGITNPTPFHLEWAYDLMEQCEDAEVPYFLKQLGSHVLFKGARETYEDGHAGEWDEWTDCLKKRQVPKTAA